MVQRGRVSHSRVVVVELGIGHGTRMALHERQRATLRYRHRWIELPSLAVFRDRLWNQIVGRGRSIGFPRRPEANAVICRRCQESIRAGSGADSFDASCVAVQFQTGGELSRCATVVLLVFPQLDGPIKTR